MAKEMRCIIGVLSSLYTVWVENEVIGVARELECSVCSSSTVGKKMQICREKEMEKELYS